MSLILGWVIAGVIFLAIAIPGIWLLTRGPSTITEIPPEESAESLVIKFEPGKEFEMQGIQGIDYSYYYSPGIYGMTYNSSFTDGIMNNTLEAGANYLLVRAAYNGNENGGVEADEEDLKSTISNLCGKAHANGVGIFLIPYVEAIDYWVNPRWELDGDVWAEKLVMWAEFAEENQIELFAPGMEMNLILSDEEVGSWFKEVLPRVKEVYSGKVTTAEHPYLDRWELLDEEAAFEGFDCIGFSFFLWRDYGSGPDMRSIEDFSEEVDQIAALTDRLADKYGTECKIAATLGLDYWQGETWEDGFPDEATKAEAYDAGLEVLKDCGFTGVFIHVNAKESGFNETEWKVLDMLKERWADVI